MKWKNSWYTWDERRHVKGICSDTNKELFELSFFRDRFSGWIYGSGLDPSRNWMFQSLLSSSISVNSLGRAVLHSSRLHPQAIETAEANGVEGASLLKAYKVPVFWIHGIHAACLHDMVSYRPLHFRQALSRVQGNLVLYVVSLKII